MALGNLAIKSDDSKGNDNAYDSVPYESYSYPQTHPEHLHTIARLFGMTPPDYRKARILELGCASGGNLLPLATLYPKCKITGIDLSKEQIDQANRHKDSLGLTNVDFHQTDIMDVGPGFGTFDYIIVHGILSWVPDEVAGKIFDIFRDNLSENGLAVVSYNTLPGWNFVKSMREMMMFHTARFTDPKEKIVQSRALLEFLAENARSDAYKQVIEQERQMLAKVNDSYLFHDHLEGINRPFYFHEVVEMMKERGLHYVGDSALTSMFVGNMPKGAMEKLGSLGDIALQEQYMDFVTNRRFRTTILAKKGAPINRALKTSQIFDFILSANIRPNEEGAEPKDKMTFLYGNGQTFSVNGTAGAALMLEISGIKTRFTMKKAVESTAKKYKIDRVDIEKAAQEVGLRLVMAGIFTLHSEEERAAREVKENPEVFALARYQATIPGTTILTNTRGDSVGTDVFANHYIRYMDGKTDLDAITLKVADHALAGDITVKQGDTVIKDKKQLVETLRPAIEQRLPALAANALLV
ncbi:MAG: methyltransferase domain-containing protein [Alphaproteobacteria bacterium]|nr:methyltransferase domain-containing protein [Alphaproteobacteria bacterium]